MSPTQMGGGPGQGRPACGAFDPREEAPYIEGLDWIPWGLPWVGLSRKFLVGLPGSAPGVGKDHQWPVKLSDAGSDLRLLLRIVGILHG